MLVGRQGKGALHESAKPCQTNLPWIPHQTPSWQYRAGSEERASASPRHCSVASSVKTARPQLYSFPQRNYNLQKETFVSPEPHILLCQSRAVPAQPEVGDKRHFIASLKGAPAWAAFQTWRADCKGLFQWPNSNEPTWSLLENENLFSRPPVALCFIQNQDKTYQFSQM